MWKASQGVCELRPVKGRPRGQERHLISRQGATCQVAWLLCAPTTTDRAFFLTGLPIGGTLLHTKVLVSWQCCVLPHTPLSKASATSSLLCTYFKAHSPLNRAASSPLTKDHFCEWLLPGIWWTDREPTSLLISVVLSSTTQRGNLEICGGGFWGSHDN